MKIVLGSMTFRASVTSLGNYLAHHPLNLAESCTDQGTPSKGVLVLFRFYFNKS